MAKIPVEKKRGGSSWWGWLIGLLVLIGVIWLVAELLSEPDVEEEPALTEEIEEPVGVDAAAAGGLITSAAMILDAEDREALAGRRVQLSSLQVTSVVGDSTFYVAPEGAEGDRRLFVALDENIPAPPPGVEGRYDVTEGQVVSLSGTVQAITRRDPEAWGITGAEAEQMMNDAIYLRAQELTIEQEANQTQ